MKKCVILAVVIIRKDQFGIGSEIGYEVDLVAIFIEEIAVIGFMKKTITVRIDVFGVVSDASVRRTSFCDIQRGEIADFDQLGTIGERFISDSRDTAGDDD